MNDEGTYKDHPLSITEIRANRSENAKDWSVRDALIAMLRRIDSGEIEQPDAVVVCIRARGSEPDTSRTYFANAAPDVHVSLGLLTVVEHRIMGSG